VRKDSIRTLIVDRLRQDLIGPGTSDEDLEDLPSDRYLTGILFPPRTAVGADQGDEADSANDDDDSDAGPENIPAASAFRPSSAGLSFAIEPGPDGLAGILIQIDAANYQPLSDESTRSSAFLPRNTWRRHAMSTEIEEILEPTDLWGKSLEGDGIAGLKLYLRVKEWNGRFLVTAALCNSASLGEKPSREDTEKHTMFQVSMRVYATLGASICRKPSVAFPNARDSESESAALIYRNAGEYAVGHTCSADWTMEGGQVQSVQTQWIPQVIVQKSKETGDEIFDSLSEIPADSPLNTRWLSEAAPENLLAGLNRLPNLYGRWIADRAAEIAGLDPVHQTRAMAHIATCRVAFARMTAGIGLLRTSKRALDAFQLANRAMWLQNSWKANRIGGNGKDLIWRPFQLAFVLLTLSSASDGQDDDRGTMDLLWFPTGGGKTEAYLLLTAYVIFLRRIKAEGEIHGAGVTVFMRYTLRLLTIQQFQRAAALVIACDLIRIGDAVSGAAVVPKHFQSDQPISIGLWVGQGSVPNFVDEAIKALESGSTSTPAQLSRCPVCDCDLKWSGSADKARIEVHCQNRDCDLGRLAAPLPVWTVDEDIYRVTPSLMIGTADKYAQLPRNQFTGNLFGLGSNVAPPDLIIQDELHLISGPLGTLAGLYEIAIDELCSANGIRPKIIGSTATIRRADEQIRALFNRNTFQFPPPGLDHGDSGFATLEADDPGRLYVGVTTAGRSAKFTLQAVSASLLQSAYSPPVPDEHRDDYWTLVTYFNSLRELGGALVLMRDDVDRSIAEYASRRGESRRDMHPPIELTSRVNSAEIPGLLEQLGRKYPEVDCVDNVLASNMISVGVDVSRLGLMVVNGQPKGIAEYIQATSRVGRSNVPGLVVTVYNANKARDRSRYETFTNWHQSLYRDVEATSVTPFAPRARDRALHAAFVAIIRHGVPGMQGEPLDASRYEAEILAVVDKVVARARMIDPDEADAVHIALRNFVDRWVSRGRIREYWNDYKDDALLMSAETAAVLAAGRRGKRWAVPSPNSLRSVEPATAFMLRPDQFDREESQ
jgi:hypothetical protein